MNKKQLVMYKLVYISHKRELGRMWESDLPKGEMAICIV